MGAIKREMNSAKWFWFAIGYECGFAYVIALIIFMLVRPYKESNKLGVKVKA